MANRGVDFKWYDGFFLSMLATSVIIVAVNWRRYHLCTYPLHIWIVVDYTAVFMFRVLMFVDNGLAAGMGLDFGRQQRYARFCGRVAVLSILSLLLYPLLWGWTVIGTLWFTKAKDCLPEEGQKWGFLIWLFFSYSGLSCIAFFCFGKWMARRQAHMVRVQQGIPVSEFGVLLDMIRVPDWAFEAAGQEMRGMGQDAAAYHPGLYFTTAQREAVAALIQELPKFMLKAVPTDCSECPICLDEFCVGNECAKLKWGNLYELEGVSYKRTILPSAVNGSWVAMCSQLPCRMHRSVAPVEPEMPSVSLLGFSKSGLKRLNQSPTRPRKGTNLIDRGYCNTGCESPNPKPKI